MRGRLGLWLRLEPQRVMAKARATSKAEGVPTLRVYSSLNSCYLLFKPLWPATAHDLSLCGLRLLTI